MIEKELKILLTKEQYMNLTRQFDWSETISQINFYYSDKSNDLKSKGTTIRIRGIDDRMKLQVKIPVSCNGAIHIKKEYEKDCKIVPYKINGSEICELCSVNNIPDVYLLGYLYTERLICNYENDNMICLDRNVYAGKTDYELEVEFIDNLDEQLLNTLDELRIRTDLEVTGKFGRFKKRIEKVNTSQRSD